MTIQRAREIFGSQIEHLSDQDVSQDPDDLMRKFINMIIDRVLEDRKQGIIKGLNYRKHSD